MDEQGQEGRASALSTKQRRSAGEATRRRRERLRQTEEGRAILAQEVALVRERRRARIASMSEEERKTHYRETARRFRERCKDDPEQRGKYRERQRRYEKAYSERLALSDEQRARRNERQRAWRASQRAKPQPSGSAYIAAAPSISRDLLVRLAAAAPRLDCHDEIVAEAALMVCEGMAEQDAVREATRRVRRDAARLRYAKPLEECYHV